MCLWVDDYSLVLRYATPRARIEHGCEECRRTIERGEIYHKWVCVEDNGDLMVYEMCAHCRAVVVVGASLTGCPESWYWGEIMNYRDGTSGFVANVLIEHDLPKGATVQMLRLVVLSKRGWRDRSGELVPVPEAA